MGISRISVMFSLGGPACSRVLQLFQVFLVGLATRGRGLALPRLFVTPQRCMAPPTADRVSSRPNFLLSLAAICVKDIFSAAYRFISASKAGSFQFTEALLFTRP